MAVRAHWGLESVPQAHGKEVQHELTDCVQATWKMRVGPSESAFRRGLQTTRAAVLKRYGGERWGQSVGDVPRAGKNQGVERK